MNKQDEKQSSQAANLRAQTDVGTTQQNLSKGSIPHHPSNTSSFYPENIPGELKELRQWVCYRLEERDGNFTKIPKNPNGGANARINDPNTWNTYQLALERSARYDGIEFMLSADDPYTFVDLDHCVDDQGTIERWAQRIINDFDSYTEYSRSGHGIHIIVRGAKPGKKCKNAKDYPQIEVYDHSRPIVMTGNLVPGTCGIIQPAANQINELYQYLFGDTESPAQAQLPQSGSTPSVEETTGGILSDSDIIKLACKSKSGNSFELLWNGNLSEYNGDWSAADQALCNNLAFWTGKDPDRMDRLFRQSGLYRDKWDRQDYRDRTIDKAIKDTLNTYQGKGKNKSDKNRSITFDNPTPEQIASAKASVDAAIEAGSNAAVFAIVEQLALLPEGEYLDAAAKIKEAIKGVDLRSLKREVSRARRQALRKQDAGDYRRLVVNNRQLRDMGDEALHIIEEANVPPVVFVRSGELTRLFTDENNMAKIQRITDSHITAYLAKHCNCVVISEEGERNVTPPRSIAEYIMAQPSYEFPPLRGIINAPPVRVDGSISTAPGYDPETRLYYHQRTACDFPKIPDNPTAKEVTAAVSLLNEIICDFPFDCEASRTHSLALFMTPILRATFDGVPQAALIDAPKQKSGKGLLSQIASIIATGTECAVTPAPMSDEEWSKVITAKLIDGPSILIWDNIKAMLGGASLEAVLTAPLWANRILGASRDVQLPNIATWIFNGNNVKTTDDMATRLFTIRIDPECSDPENRTGFKHPYLKRWVSDNRGRIIAAIVTLFKAWIASGRPEHSDIPRVGAYEEWAFTIGNILQHAGINGFLANQKDMKARMSTESPQWELFLMAWREVLGTNAITVKEFLTSLDEHPELENTTPADLAKALESRTPQGKSVNVGRVFANRENTRFGDTGLHIYRDGDRKRAVLWRLGDVAHKKAGNLFNGESNESSESVKPNMHENHIFSNRDNKSCHGAEGDLDSIHSPDSPPTPTPVEVSRREKAAGMYECGKCKQPVGLQPGKSKGTFEYGCECGHRGLIPELDYQQWCKNHGNIEALAEPWEGE
jgi:DNA-directed RNA polymerase subunit RPC12/RpoP